MGIILPAIYRRSERPRTFRMTPLAEAELAPPSASAAAISLYGSLGFCTANAYYYRVASLPETTH